MLYKLNFYIIVFSLIVGVVLYDFIGKYAGFTYTDEILVLLLFVYWLIAGEKTEQRSREFLVFSFVAVFYLLLSLYRPNNVTPAIFMDFLIQVKPFVAFYTVFGLNMRFRTEDKRNIRRLCIAMAVLLFPIGVLYLAGKTEPLYNLMHHPSRYATAYQILGVAYLLFSPKKERYLWISLVIVSISIMSLRSKAFGFCALYVFFVLLRNRIKARHLFSLRNFAILASIVSAVLFFAWEKFEYYFIIGGENEFARPMLYSTGFDILKQYPLFGTGFGSYAEYASAVYYSPLYKQFGLNFIHGLSEDGESFICDTYFPVLTQVGLVGIMLFFGFWLMRMRAAQKKYLQDRNIETFGLSIVIIIFFMIESVADSTLTHNRGIVMMMMLAINQCPRRLDIWRLLLKKIRNQKSLPL